MGTMTGPSRMHDLWDEAGKSLLQAVADLGVFGREIQMMVMPSQRNLTEITSKSNPKSLALGDGGQEIVISWIDSERRVWDFVKPLPKTSHQVRLHTL